MAAPNPLQDLFNAARLAALTALTATVTGDLVNAAASGKPIQLDPVAGWVLDEIEKHTGAAEQTVGAPIFDTIIGAAIGVDLSPLGAPEAQSALGIIKRIIGFTVALPFATTQLHAALKAVLGEHAPVALLDAIKELPAELGMNFFIPQILTNVVDVATGTPLREAIAEQTRPFRLEWPQLRQLARQHLFTDAELDQRLRKIGVPEGDLPLLHAIDQQLLPVGDLQQAYLSGLMDEATVRDRLTQLGFPPADVEILIQLYLVRAETAGGDALRLAAQEGFLSDHLTEGQYRAILDQVHVPAASAELEVEATSLRKSFQEHQLTVSELKALTVDGTLSDTEAVLRLVQLHYSQLDAAALVSTWHKTARAAHAGLTVPRVLAYLAHSVLTTTQAYDYLVGLNIRPQDARFLVEHPTLSVPVVKRQASQTTIISAYIDGVVDRTQAARLLAENQVPEEEARLSLQVADDRIARGPKPKAPHKTLSEAAVIEAFRLGLASDGWAVRELVTQGYSDQDALLLVAIEQAKLDKAVPPGWTVLT